MSKGQKHHVYTARAVCRPCAVSLPCSRRHHHLPWPPCQASVIVVVAAALVAVALAVSLLTSLVVVVVVLVVVVVALFAPHQAVSRLPRRARLGPAGDAAEVADRP